MIFKHNTKYSAPNTQFDLYNLPVRIKLRCVLIPNQQELSFPDGKGEAVFEAQPPAQFPWTVFF